MRIVVLALATGCSSILGLDEPRRLDAGADAVPVGDAAPVFDAAIDAPNDGCPASYTLVGSSRYRMITDALTWLDAATMCAFDGVSATKRTHLAVIGNNIERSNLTAYDSVNNGVFWLGLSDRVTEGQYLWVTAENTGGYPPDTGLPWSLGEPSGTEQQDCLATTDNALFQDAICTSTVPALCECDSFANDSSRY